MSGPPHQAGYEVLSSRTASKPGYRRKTWLLRGIGLAILIGECDDCVTGFEWVGLLAVPQYRRTTWLLRGIGPAILIGECDDCVTGLSG